MRDATADDPRQRTLPHLRVVNGHISGCVCSNRHKSRMANGELSSKTGNEIKRDGENYIYSRQHDDACVVRRDAEPKQSFIAHVLIQGDEYHDDSERGE